jgi:hypothetical protein
MSYRMVQKGMGQLGGAWGWFALWGNRGQSWQPVYPGFIGWFYTDYETARFLIRRAHGTMPGYVPDQAAAKHIFFSEPVRWQEIVELLPGTAPGGGPCTDESGCLRSYGKHISWVYPQNHEVADSMDDLANGVPKQKPGYAQSANWVKYTIISDQYGRRVY